MTVINSQCSRCAHQWVGRLACEAYPRGIPVDVIHNGRLHLDRLEDQEGAVTYKPDGLRPEYVPREEVESVD